MGNRQLRSFRASLKSTIHFFPSTVCGSKGLTAYETKKMGQYYLFSHDISTLNQFEGLNIKSVTMTVPFLIDTLVLVYYTPI